MVGNNKNKWLPHQLDLLERLIDGGTSYDDAVPLVGHSILSCRTTMSEIRSRRHNGQERMAIRATRLAERAAAAAARAKAAEPVADRKIAPGKPTIVPDPPHARSTSTAKLVMDAELRGRIELQGVTAGLLGDPMPGRSALDRKREEARG